MGFVTSQRDVSSISALMVFKYSLAAAASTRTFPIRPSAGLPHSLLRRQPKRFIGLPIDVITAACAAPLPFELHQPPTIEAESWQGFGLRNPCGTIVGMAALEFDVA